VKAILNFVSKELNAEGKKKEIKKARKLSLFRTARKTTETWY